MVARGRGLIDRGDRRHRRPLPRRATYDLVKASAIRLALGEAADLRPHGVAALALTPGFLRSEAMLDHFGVDRADTWRDAIATDSHFAYSETPHFLGRAVVALASDPAIMEKSGGRFATWDSRTSTGSTTSTARGRTGARTRPIGLRAVCFFTPSPTRPPGLRWRARGGRRRRGARRHGAADRSRRPAPLTLAHVAEECGLVTRDASSQRFGSKRGLLLAVARRPPDLGAHLRGACADAPAKALVMAALVALTASVRTPEAIANKLAFLQLDLADGSSAPRRSPSSPR